MCQCVNASIPRSLKPIYNNPSIAPTQQTTRHGHGAAPFPFPSLRPPRRASGASSSSSRPHSREGGASEDGSLTGSVPSPVVGRGRGAGQRAQEQQEEADVSFFCFFLLYLFFF